MNERRIELMALDDIQGAQRNPKDHDIGELSKSVGRFGFTEAPLMDERTGRLVAGHGRIETLRALQARPGSKPPEGVQVDAQGRWLVPVARGWASRSDRDAEAYLLASNRLTELGGWKDSELGELLAELAKDNALEGVGWDASGVDDLLKELAEASAPGADGTYTRAVESPAYTPKGPCPPVSDLSDSSRAEELGGAIASEPDLDPEVRAFLLAAAQRHRVFRYDRIAEFYAHAPAKVQRLMEDSALVIVDFNRAIELGFVALTEELREAYVENPEA